MSQESDKTEAESTAQLLTNVSNEVKSLQQKVTPMTMSNHYLTRDDDMELKVLVRRLRKTVNVLTALVVASVLGVLVLSVVFAVLFSRLKFDVRTHEHVHEPNVRERMDSLLSRRELCFDCLDLQTGPSFEEGKMLDEFRRKLGVDGELLCCVDTARQLLKKLEMYVEKKFWQEVSRGNVKLPGFSEKLMTVERPVALLISPMVQQGQRGAPGSQFAISGWATKQDIAILNFANYRRGRIIVPSSGYYYVFSQVSFLELFEAGSKVTSRSQQSQSLSHYLYRYNTDYLRGGEEKLLQNSQTKCWSRHKSFGEYSSYIGAVIFLRRGDEVYVKVSNISILSEVPKANYFGLYKL